MNIHPPHRSLRWPARLLAASMTLALVACGTTASNQVEATPSKSALAPGWQEQARPLFNVGPGPTAGSTVWMVSSLLPRGRYEVISRDGDRARVLDGHGFVVDGSTFKEIRLILPFTGGDVEAVDERWVVASQSQPQPK